MCDQCDCLNINGQNCHEFGCPNQSKDKFIFDDSLCECEFRVPTDGPCEYCSDFLSK